MSDVHSKISAIIAKPSSPCPLGMLQCGDSGYIQAVRAAATSEGNELERRLLEMGFIEGAHVELLHEGFIGRDPIAVRVNQTTVALRRSEANAVLVNLL